MSFVRSFMLISLGTIFATILSTLVFALPKVLVATGLMKSGTLATSDPTTTDKPSQQTQKHQTESMNRFADYQDDVQMSADISRNASGDPLRSGGNGAHSSGSGNTFDRYASRKAIKGVSPDGSVQGGDDVITGKGTKGRQSSRTKSLEGGTNDTTV